MNYAVIHVLTNNKINFMIVTTILFKDAICHKQHDGITIQELALSIHLTAPFGIFILNPNWAFFIEAHVP